VAVGDGQHGDQLLAPERPMDLELVAEPHVAMRLGSLPIHDDFV
jgi:hypothetical protein